MKKIMTLMLSFAMILSLATVANAETVTSMGTNSADVKIKYESDEPVAYNIDIIWGSMEFDFNANDVWNSTDYKWEPSKDASWAPLSDIDNLIKITNRSSIELNAAFSFNPEVTGVTGGNFESSSFTTDTSTLLLPKPTAGSPATEYSVTFMPEGELSNSFTDYDKIGSVIITLTTTTAE